MPVINAWRQRIKKNQILLIATFFIIGPTSVLIGFFPQKISQLLPMMWLFFIIATFLLITKHRQLRLMDHRHPTPPLPKSIWMIAIITIEIFCWLLFNSIIELSNDYLPLEFIHAGLNKQQSTDIMISLLLNGGLFPFSLYALLSCILGYAYFYLGQPGLLSALTPALKSTYVDRRFRIGINLFCAKLTDICAVIILIVGILQLHWLMLSVLGLDNADNIHAGAIMVYACSSMLLILPFYDHYIKRLTQYSRRAWIFILPFIIVAVLLLVVSTLVGDFFYQQIATRVAAVIAAQKENIIRLLDWHLFYWSWWICLAPWISSMIARLSRGRTLGEIIVATLLLPATIAIIVLLDDNTRILSSGLTNFIIFLQHSTTIRLLAPWTVIIFMMTLTDGRYSLFGFMPYRKSYITARPFKIAYLMKPLLQFTGIMITAFLMANLRSIQLLTTLGAIPATALFSVYGAGFYAILVSRKE